MNKKEIRGRIARAREAAEKEVSAHRIGRIAAGLAREGYVGGYIDALNHVELLLNDVEPDHRFFRRTGK